MSIACLLVPNEGGARVKCVGGLVESGLVRKTVKYCKGVQHNYRLAKNTKKKELGTAHHNDASSTGYLITVMLHQYI